MGMSKMTKHPFKKITLSQPVTMLYFYIETCSECQSFKETAIPYLEETFGDSLTIQQYDLDDDTTQAVYEDVMTPPFLNETKMVVIKKADFLTTKKLKKDNQDVEIFKKCMDQIDDHCSSCYFS